MVYSYCIPLGYRNLIEFSVVDVEEFLCYGRHIKITVAVEIWTILNRYTVFIEQLYIEQIVGDLVLNEI